MSAMCQSGDTLALHVWQAPDRHTCQSRCTSSYESAKPPHLSRDLSPGMLTATAACDMAMLPKLGCIQLAALRLLLMEGQVAHQLP